jgi:hypothetical protein
MFFGSKLHTEEKTPKKPLFINHLKLQPALTPCIPDQGPTKHKVVENKRNNSQLSPRQ